jgi:hypothetical protein
MFTIRRTSIPALAVLVFGASGAYAGELPQYEVQGFPISPVQFSLLGSGGVQEQSPTPNLTMHGMPASLHQIAVIGHRTKQHFAGEPNKKTNQPVDD